MEIVRERLEREYDLEPRRHRPEGRVPSVHNDGGIEVGRQPVDDADPNEIEAIEEPYVTITILTPTEYVGTLMELCQSRRGEMQKLEYLSEERVELVYRAAARPRSSWTSSTR